MTLSPRLIPLSALAVLIISPMVLVFISSNVVNVGNLLFNIVFSRWMGPALFGDLAVVLTIKLALLGVLAAIQMAVSRHVAASSDSDHSALARLNMLIFAGLWLLAPMMAVAILYGELGQNLGMLNPNILLIILLSLPFAGPLSVLRGVVHGRLDAKAILLSANIEMLVRLFGAIILWQMGYGIYGVTAAIALSIVSGWAVLARKLPLSPKTKPQTRKMAKLIMAAAFPFAMLQGAQALLLDGDILVAKALFDEVQAGQIAAIGLFQRIEFFACFALAGIMLPAVSRAVAQGRSCLKEVSSVIVLFTGVTFIFLLGVFTAPEAMINIMVGDAYLPAAELLSYACVAAALFTMTYLLVTFLAALGNHFGIWLVVLWAPLQLAAFYLFGISTDYLTPVDLMTVKLVSQLTLTGALLIYVLARILSERPLVIKANS